MLVRPGRAAASLCRRLACEGAGCADEQAGARWRALRPLPALLDPAAPPELKVRLHPLTHDTQADLTQRSSAREPSRCVTRNSKSAHQLMQSPPSPTTPPKGGYVDVPGGAHRSSPSAAAYTPPPPPSLGAVSCRCASPSSAAASCCDQQKDNARTVKGPYKDSERTVPYRPHLRRRSRQPDAPGAVASRARSAEGQPRDEWRDGGEEGVGEAGGDAG